MRDFARGMGLLGRGFAYWRRRPGLMDLGLLPAVLVGAVLLSGFVVLGFFLPGLTDAMTPFADTWPPPWAVVIRIAVGGAVFGAALVVAVVSFTALTLVAGEPFYDRIWRAVESDLGDAGIDAGYGIWRSFVDALSLFARGIGVAVLTAGLSLVPVVGSALGAVGGVLLTGWLVADELSSRALTARGMTRAQRKAIVRGHRGRMLGFGVAVQLFFLIPFGAIAVMPAAVAGSTLLARSILDGTPDGHGAATGPGEAG